MESKTELQRSQDLCHRRMLTISGMERELAEVYDRANNLRLAYDAQTRKLAEAQEAKGHFYDKMCDREDELAALRTAAARVVSKLESMKEFGDAILSDQPDFAVQLDQANRQVDAEEAEAKRDDGYANPHRSDAAPDAGEGTSDTLVLADEYCEECTASVLDCVCGGHFDISKREYDKVVAAREEAERKVDILRTKLHAAEMYSTTQWVLDAQAERDQLQQRLDAVVDKLRSFRNGYFNQGYPMSLVAADFSSCIEVALAGTEGGKDDA